MGTDGVNTTSITDAMGHENIEVTNAAGLTETTTSKGNLGESISTKFTYDTNGNKTKETYENGAYKTYHYDKKNRLTETNTYEAPEAGSETGTRTLKTSYSYDGNDQLIEMVDYQVSGNTETAYRYTECEYDGLQRKTVYAELSQSEKPTADEIKSHAIKYTYDAEGKLTKVTYPTKKDGVRSLSYHYTSDGWLSLIKADVYKGSDVKEATVRTYAYDSYGKVTEIKDYRNLLSDGDKAVKKTYEDFGETQSVGANTAKNETCYTGGRYDETTGLYYLNARYYNPEDGRFLTEDTYRGETNEPDTQHLYVYCADNPVNYVDPSGHKSMACIYYNAGHNLTKQAKNSPYYLNKSVKFKGVGTPNTI